MIYRGRIGRNRGNGFSTIDRVEAAYRLRAARAARTADASEREATIDRVLYLLPDARHSLRMKIELLLADGDTTTAGTLLARALLARPTDPMLMRLHAECLLMQDATREADKEIQLVLGVRPRHVTTILLAARIAAARGEHARAIRLIEDASAMRPEREDILEQLGHFLLNAKRVERAAAAVARVRYPSAVLRARLLDARGQTNEAIEVLEVNRHGAVDPDGANTIALIDLLERTGPPARLRRLLPGIRSDRPRALARAGAAWLRLGAFRLAATRTAGLRGDGPVQRQALSVLLVAASMLGRHGLAERARRRLERLHGGPGHRYLADLWRRAFTARQMGPRTGIDRRPVHAGVLSNMVQRALGDLEHAISASDPADGARLGQLQRHRMKCVSFLAAEPSFNDAGLNTSGGISTPATAEAATTSLPFPPPRRRAA